MKSLLRHIIPLGLWPPLIQLHSSLMSRKKYRFQVSINQCVHYGGFRYGQRDYHPLETYLSDIQHQVPIAQARWKLIRFLLHYRPRHMGDALGLGGLSRHYPLWTYPWEVRSRHPNNAWWDAPDRCPDMLTQFCESGISSYRIDAEFLMGERILRSIATHGYRPGYDPTSTCQTPSPPPIRTFELRKCDGRRAYLLLDGNHRVSALSALGETQVTVEQAATHMADEKDCEHWYGVKTGLYTREDVLRIFNAYFEGNRHYHTCDHPAPIIGPKQWLCLYKHMSLSTYGRN
jgi:hypothetical protein